MNIQLSKMDYWYSRLPGSMLLAMEQTELDKILPQWQGQFIVQIGGPRDLQLLRSSVAVHRVHLGANIQTDFNHLPLLPQSVDIFVVLHTLERAATPGKMIRELYEAQAAGGVFVIFGFNPLSLWNLVRLGCNRHEFPWNGHFWSPWQLRRCLHSVGYHIISYKTFLFRPPVHGVYWSERLLFLETLGQFCFPALGGAYCIVAQKVTRQAIKIRKSVWWADKVPVNKGYEPTVRRDIK